MENEISATKSENANRFEERREFHAGVSWYAIWIPFLALFVGVAFLGLRDGQWKKNFLPGGLVALMDCIFFYNFISRVPLWPWYRGPTLIVDQSGLKTEKWFIPWGEIEKIGIFRVGKATQIGIIKNGQRSWELPYLVEGPLGEPMIDVVHYLQVRKSAFMQI